LAANSFMKIQSQNSIKKKGAVPVGRAPDYPNSPPVRWTWLGGYDVVRHPARQSIPHLARHEALDLADADAELEELLHRLMKTSPLVAVLVVAGVEERPPAAALLLELLRQLVQHGHDLGLVALQALGVKPDVPDDTLGLDVLTGVLAISEQAIHEDRVDQLCVETCRRAHSAVLLSRYCFIPSRHIAQISCHLSIPDHKSQEAASAASWECLKNFSFLLLQNMVRADLFSGSLAVFRFAAKLLIFTGGFLAAAGGEMRSNYFKNGAPRWKSQYLARALPALGDQIVRSFRDKKKFPIPLKAEKKNFSKS